LRAARAVASDRRAWDGPACYPGVVDPTLYDDVVPVPRAARFPIELRPPAAFHPDDPATWPSVDGRLELIDGRLLYMPPCGDTQQYVATMVSFVLARWARAHPAFVVGSNEAGMRLGADTRGADAAVWLRAEVSPRTGKFQRVPPVLAVEVAGLDEEEPRLEEKARWYLAHGVKLVWLILPDTREVVVVRPEGRTRHGLGEALPPAAELPGLAARVDELLAQIIEP
jgi:Uma2 family endonuclease